MKLNQTVKSLIMMIALSVSGVYQVSFAQDVNEVRWKSESHVKSLYGEPNSVQGPIGTHATYELWKYDSFTVAFANNRAFHLFSVKSGEMSLEEDRPES